ncbi:MAG TPA: efflux RND transporter permease subunit, partial [Myxococcales bacterium]|nr:efflux RND transporter permease subunit [Myxococcales bacterium]
SVGDAFRMASLVKGSEEAVGGVIVARSGVNTQHVIDAVKARIAQIAPGLPPGVKIVPFYDRSDLIARSIGTLRTAGAAKRSAPAAAPGAFSTRAGWYSNQAWFAATLRVCAGTTPLPKLTWLC